MRKAVGMLAGMAVLGACGSSSKPSALPTTSVSPLSLGTGASNPACQILSQLGAAEILKLSLPQTVTPGPAHQLHDEQACFQGKPVTVYLTEDAVNKDSCFGTFEAARLSGHAACLEYAPTAQVQVSIKDGKYTDVEVVLFDVKESREVLKPQLIALGTRAAALARPQS